MSSNKDDLELGKAFTLVLDDTHINTARGLLVSAKDAGTYSSKPPPALITKEDRKYLRSGTSQKRLERKARLNAIRQARNQEKTNG